jgi:hypothetical protein
MSSSIVLSLRLFGMPDGAEEVLVMAVALGLCLAVAVSLWRPMRRRRAVALVDVEPACDGRRLRPRALMSHWPGSTPVGGERPAADPAVGEAQAPGSAEPAGIPVIGYVTLPDRAGTKSDEQLAKQAEIIARACERRGLVLLEVVSDTHSSQGLARSTTVAGGRPRLRYALGRIAAGEAGGLVVPGLRRLAESTAELGPIVAWFLRREARLVAVAQGFDSGERDHRLAARLIMEVSRWERERMSETAHGYRTPSHGGAGSAALGPPEPDLLSHSGGRSS